MVRKVYESVGDRRFAALKQGLGGSGTTSEYQAAQKLGLLTKHDSSFLMTDDEGKLPVSSVSNAAIVVVPKNPKKHYVGEFQDYEVPGMVSLDISFNQSDLEITNIEGNKFSLKALTSGTKTFIVNGVTVSVLISAIEFVAPILENGKGRIITVNQRSKTLILDLSNQPDSLVNSVESVEWEARNHLGEVVDSLTTSGSAYVCTIPAEGEYRIVRARLNAAGSIKSPWSNSVMVDFIPSESWISDPVANGARYGCFADQRIVVDSNYGREANVIEPTELSKENKDILRTIEKPSDSGTFMINPHEGIDGDIISVCYGDSSFVAENYLKWGFEGQLCIFNYNTDGFTKEQLENTSDPASLKSSSRKARKLPRLQKDGVFYKVDPTVLALSKNGSRIVGAVYGASGTQDGRFSGVYTYRRISAGSYIQEELIPGSYSYDVDVSEDGRTLIRFEDDNRKKMVVLRKEQVGDGYSQETIDLGIHSPSFVSASLRFTENENFVVVYGIDDSGGRLYIVDIENKSIVDTTPVSYSITALDSTDLSSHRIRCSIDRKTFVISTGESFTSFRINFEEDIPEFQILKTGAGIGINTARVSKIRSDGKVLLNVCEPEELTTVQDTIGVSRFAHQVLDDAAEMKKIYPEAIVSTYPSQNTPSVFVSENVFLPRNYNYDQRYFPFFMVYRNYSESKHFFRIVFVDRISWQVVSDQLLFPSEGGYFSHSRFNSAFFAEISENLETIVVFSPNTDMNIEEKHGSVYVFRKVGNSYLEKKLPGLDTQGRHFRGTALSKDGTTIFVTNSTTPSRDLQIFKLSDSGDFILQYQGTLRIGMTDIAADIGIDVDIVGNRNDSNIIDICHIYYPANELDISVKGRLCLARYTVETNTLTSLGYIEVEATYGGFPYGYYGHYRGSSRNGRLVNMRQGAPDQPTSMLFIVEVTNSGLLKTYLQTFMSPEELELNRSEDNIIFDPVEDDHFYCYHYSSGKTYITRYKYISQNNVQRLTTEEISISSPSVLTSFLNKNIVSDRLLIKDTDVGDRSEFSVYKLG